MKGVILGGLGMIAGWQLCDLFYHGLIDGVMTAILMVVSIALVVAVNEWLEGSQNDSKYQLLKNDA